LVTKEDVAIEPSEATFGEGLKEFCAIVWGEQTICIVANFFFPLLLRRMSN
jgi:hypothetical protein